MSIELWKLNIGVKSGAQARISHMINLNLPFIDVACAGKQTIHSFFLHLPQSWMPEFPELTAFTYRVREAKGSRLKPQDVANLKCKQHIPNIYWLALVKLQKSTDFSLVNILVSPLCFSEGSKKKPYINLSVDSSEFTVPMRLATSHGVLPLPWVQEFRGQFLPPNVEWPPQHWIDRSAGNIEDGPKPWHYLLNDECLTPGPLIAISRGKLMVLAAGNVWFCFKFKACYILLKNLSDSMPCASISDLKGQS